MNREEYERKVLEQNNEGDPIGGDAGSRQLIGLDLATLIKQLQRMQDALAAGGQEYATPVLLDNQPVGCVEIRFDGYVVIHSLRREAAPLANGPGEYPLLGRALDDLNGEGPMGFHSHVKKGGGYIAKGFAKGAGSLFGVRLALYQSTSKDQTFYVRTLEDFNRSMIRPAADIREHLVNEEGKGIGRGPAGSSGSAVPSVWVGWDMAAVEKAPGVGMWLVEPDENPQQFDSVELGDLGDIGK